MQANYELRAPISTIPYRLDLAGGWLDQPFVSKLAAGAVITISVEPVLTAENAENPVYGFNERSGMASSTRKRAMEIWPEGLPADRDPQQLAKILFSYENPPGTTMFSGSQDALGICLPGVNRLDYNGGYWPEKITSITNEETLGWLESVLWLVPLSPRASAFDVFKGSAVNASDASKLSFEADRCWDSIVHGSERSLGLAMVESFYAQTVMFPAMMTREVNEAISKLRADIFGFKLSGAGGGGYLVLVSEKPMDGASRIRIRR